MRDRTFLIHYCRVVLRECRARRHQRVFAFTLLSWAANARREAQALHQPAQVDLFRDAA